MTPEQEKELEEGLAKTDYAGVGYSETVRCAFRSGWRMRQHKADLIVENANKWVKVAEDATFRAQATEEKLFQLSRIVVWANEHIGWENCGSYDMPIEMRHLFEKTIHEASEQKIKQ